MALFKVNRGNSATLPVVMTDGWAYFCTDTGEFFIDYADSNGELHRKQINADEAKKLAGYDISNILNSSEVEIPTSAAVKTYIDNAQIQSDLGQTDETASDYVKGIIRQESLPEGYPYKENKAILNINKSLSSGANFVTCSDPIKAGTTYTLTVIAPNGSVQKKTFLAELDDDGSRIIFGVTFEDFYNCSVSFNYFVSNKQLLIGFSGPGQVAGSTFTIIIEEPSEIHKMAVEYLPDGVVIDTLPWEDITNKPFEIIGIKSENSTSVNSISPSYIYSGMDLPGGGSIYVTEPYVVIFDGEYFECEAVVKGTDASAVVYLGNLSLCNAGEDNGLPFCFEAPRMVGRVTIYTADTSTEHTIEAYLGHLGVKYLDDKYISDNIARKAYVDEQIATKQDKLTFDETPTEGSTNPVTSEGIKNYVDSKEFVLPEGYAVSENVVIEWDGDTTGLVNLVDMYYKVSDLILTDDEIKAGIVTQIQGENTVNYSISDYWDEAVAYGHVSDDYVVCDELILFVKKPRVQLEGIVIEEAGIYFRLRPDGEEMYKQTSRFETTVITTMSPTLLPEDIAYKPYVDEMLETKADNDHVHSADDLKVVSYDASQELTDEQRTTARNNIDTMSTREIEECVNNAVANAAGIQIVTWEADD